MKGSGCWSILAEEAAHGSGPKNDGDIIASPQLCDVCLLLLCNLVDLHFQDRPQCHCSFKLGQLAVS